MYYMLMMHSSLNFTTAHYRDIQRCLKGSLGRAMVDTPLGGDTSMMVGGCGRLGGKRVAGWSQWAKLQRYDSRIITRIQMDRDRLQLFCLFLFAWYCWFVWSGLRN